jgi:hypothetical protein
MHEQRDSRRTDRATASSAAALRSPYAFVRRSPRPRALQINNVRGQVEKLPPEQRRVIAGMVNSTVKTLNELFYKVLAIPGVAQELKPIVEAMKVDLVTLTTAT